jgi:hypothetical protein
MKRQVRSFEGLKIREQPNEVVMEWEEMEPFPRLCLPVVAVHKKIGLREVPGPIHLTSKPM